MVRLEFTEINWFVIFTLLSCRCQCHSHESQCHTQSVWLTVTDWHRCACESVWHSVTHSLTVGVRSTFNFHVQRGYQVKISQNSIKKIKNNMKSSIILNTRAHQYRLTAVSAVIQSAARLERGRTLNNVRGREGGEGRGGGGQGRAGQGRGRAGEGRGGDCPHFPQTRTFVTAEPSRPPAKRVTG